MFSCCCGCKKDDQNNDRRDDVLRCDSSLFENNLNLRNRSVELPILNRIEGPGAASKMLMEPPPFRDEPIYRQPPTTSNTKTNNRQSDASEVKVDVSDNDDDEVFCEGIGPPIRLADNLGIPTTKDQVHVPLPKWFSQHPEDTEDEDDVEGPEDGKEPPATPVGRDELALRRHRFFSELINVSQNPGQHRVRFDPLGPIIAGASNNAGYLANDLEALIARLEQVTERLEQVYGRAKETLKQNYHQISQLSEQNIILSESEEQEENSGMSVQAFSDILQGPFAQYLSISKQIGGDVAKHSDIVNQAFQAQLQYLTVVSQSKQPSSQSEQIALLQPTSVQIGAIQDFREKNRTSTFFNHLSGISESIPALGWVTVSPAPAPYVKEMNDAGQFYTNRVLKDWKEKDKKHVDWVKAWIQTLTELQAFVKQHHTTGLVWAGKTAPPSAIGTVPPPPPGCPPPPPILENLSITDDGSHDRSALFAQINQGQDITKSLKKVTSDMQTHKNPTLRTGPAPFKTPITTGHPHANAAPIDKPPSFVRDGKKWLIEYQKGNQNLLVENADMNNVVYLFKCTESTIVVKGKINSITLDSCKKTSVVFDSLVSSCEFINCQSVQMQVFGKVPTISVDKTDGCQMYLSQDSLGVEIVSSKSSEMNVLVPRGNGDYMEYPVPEQYKTTVNSGGTGLSTIVVESKG